MIPSNSHKKIDDNSSRNTVLDQIKSNFHFLDTFDFYMELNSNFKLALINDNKTWNQSDSEN